MLSANVPAMLTRTKFRDPVAILFLVLLSLRFFYPILFLNAYTNLGGWDSSVQSFAWYAHIARAFQEGSFPFWDMHTEAGEFFAGEVQTAAFYPPAWLFALVFDSGELEGFQHWAEAYSIFHVVLGSVFAYALFRQLQLGCVAAVSGAVIAMYFGAIAVRMAGQPNIHAGMCYLPVVLYLVLRAWQGWHTRQGVLYASLAGLALGCCILTGHMYSYIHTALLAFLLLALSIWKQPGQYLDAVKLLAIMAVCSLLVAYPQLDAMLEYFSRANKWYGAGYTSYPHVVPFSEFSRWGFSAWDTLLGTCSSGCGEGRTIHVGLTALPLALLGLTVSSHARRIILPVLIIMFVIASAGDNLIGKLLYHTPLLSNVRIPSRILFAYPLFLGLLAATGLNWLLNKSPGKIWTVLILAVVALGFTLDLGNQQLRWAVGGVPRALAPYDPVDYYTDPVADWLVQALGANSLYRWHAEPKELLPPNLGQVNGTNSLAGHRSSMHENYFQYSSAPADSSGWNQRLGLRYFVTRNNYPQYTLVFSNAGRNVYEVTDTLPLVHSLLGAQRQPLPLQQVSWETNALQFRVDPEYQRQAGERIFFGITWFPGWTLLVDGKQRELRYGTAEDGAFMSAVLEPADTLVRLSYRPVRWHAYWILPGLYLLWLGYQLWRAAIVGAVSRRGLEGAAPGHG